MFLKLINFPLRPGERMAAIVRQSNGKIIFPLLISFFIYLAAFFFLFKFISWGKWGLALFGFLLFLGTFYVFYKFYFWYFNAVILTSQRIIDIHQKKFFERIVSDIAYHQIKDVVVKIKGLRQSLTHSGNILLVLDGGSDNLEFRYIKHPEKARELILEIRAEAAAENPPYSPFNKRGNGGGFNRNEKIGQIYEEIKNLDEATLERILARLPEVIREESKDLFFSSHKSTQL